VPFLFTVKQLDAKGTLDAFGGDFVVPSYRGSTFLDPKGRGGATGYDTAVALPAKGDDDSLMKENIKVVAGGKGSAVFSVAKVRDTEGRGGGRERERRRRQERERDTRGQYMCSRRDRMARPQTPLPSLPAPQHADNLICGSSLLAPAPPKKTTVSEKKKKKKNQVDAGTGEIAGVFESIQPSDTDLGAKASKDVKVTGLWYAQLK